MKEIRREAGDKTKGFTLQKQRALSLFFDEIKNDPNAHINVAIEYKGDVYLQKGKNGYIEEQKNYNESSAFSFNSSQILNTLVYFLEIWLSEGKSKSIKFGFYSTNKIGKEYKTERTEKLEIILPAKSILEFVSIKNYTEEPNLLELTKKYLVDEYFIQYKKDITSDLDYDSLIVFFNSINWYFEQDNEKEYDKLIIEKINESEFAVNLKSAYAAEFAYAALMFALEKKQDESDPILKFLRKESVENIFLKIGINNSIEFEAYKYLTFDYSELNQKIKEYLLSFLKSKYFSNIHDKAFPVIIQRKVAKHNKEVKIERKNLEETNPEQAKHLEVVIKELGDLINSERPSFLFGDIGSGKSTLLAHYFLNDIENGTFPIFIPSSFLKGKISNELKSFKESINFFVNHEIDITNKFFDLDTVLLTKKEIVLIIDGLDEFDRPEAQKLLQHLLSLSANYVNIRIIASGRPIELQEIVNFNEWNCLTTLDLSEDEIKQILKNEAIAIGLDFKAALSDSEKRYDILFSKNELYSNATTPLIVCLIRDFLTEDVSSKTLGDIMYDVFKKRLIWNEEDKKENFIYFINEFPNVIQRETFISKIAYIIYHSPVGKIKEDEIFQIVNSNELIPPETNQRTRVVNDAILFFKNNFLQKIGEDYLFQSYQLFQLALGLELFNQTISGKIFTFKLDYINEWRIISFAGAISRRKGESAKMQHFFISVLDELLLLDAHTAASAVLLTEVRDDSLNNHFIDKVQTLGFRPLRFWGNPDTLVPHAYGYIINAVGKKGFDWFFENYLSPSHPARTGSDDYSNSILKYYLIIKSYNLEEYEKNILTSIIPFHKAARTFACNTLLPTLALVLPERFDIKERCILLAQVLEKNIVSKRAEFLLTEEWNLGYHDEVKRGLEIGFSDNSTKSNSIVLWLHFVNDNIPKKLLNAAIKLIAKGNDLVFTIIKEKIGEANFKSYLRYSTLVQNEISDSAAIILYRNYDEKDLILIAETLMTKTEWFDFKNNEREKIINDILFSNGENGFTSIINHIPVPEREFGIPEMYIKLFLKCILASNQLYLNEFIYIVRYLGKFSLSRYPEIRELFVRVLANVDYYDRLKLMLEHLDSNLRYNAASILLVCFPESEKDALEIIIRSIFKRDTDYQEFLRLCMKLNYSKITLNFIYDLLDDLPEISRLLALKLLYHNEEYKLTSELKTELLKGVLGKASFLEWSGVFADDGIERIASKSEYFQFFKSKLYSNDLQEIQSVSSILINFHFEKLNNSEKAKCWLFQIQHSDFLFVDFCRNHIKLLENLEFTTELKKHAKDNEKLLNGTKFILLTFYSALKENGKWKDFFLTLLGIDQFMSHDKIERMYEILISIGQKDSENRKRIGESLKELMSYPVFSQDTYYNNLLPEFAIIAHEFGSIDNEYLKKIIAEYRISKSELACSLLCRINENPVNYHQDKSLGNHIVIYKEQITESVKQFDDLEIEKLLIDGDDIPINLFLAIEWVLINGIYSNDELIQLSNKSNMSSYFAIVVSFSRLVDIQLNDFFRAKEIGSFKYFARARTQYNKSILLKIKDVLLCDNNVKQNYVDALIQSIDTNKSSDVIDVFENLFELKASFEQNLLLKLIDSLLDIPYKLNLDLLHDINSFVLNIIEVEDREQFISPIKQRLKAVLSFGNKKHENEYELIAWNLSLILLFIDGKYSREAETGFLVGLKNIFIQDGSDYCSDTIIKKFKGRDLIIYSENILSQIDSSIIREILENGIKSKVPEISSICKLFRVFNN